MDECEFLQRICEGYVRCYRTLNISGEHGSADMTQREINYFVRLGEALGFPARQEENKDDLRWKAPHTEEVFLHLERETTRGRAINKALKRLLDSNASRLIAVLNHIWQEDIDKINAHVRDQIGNRSIAVIAWVGQPGPNDVKELVALVYSQEKLFSRTAKVGQDEAGFWYAHFGEEVGSWTLEGNMRTLPADALGQDEDWVGNNAAFRCPACGRVFIVSGLLHKDGRPCPKCGRSVGRVSGGRESGGQATLEWESRE